MPYSNKIHQIMNAIGTAQGVDAGYAYKHNLEGAASSLHEAVRAANDNVRLSWCGVARTYVKRAIRAVSDPNGNMIGIGDKIKESLRKAQEGLKVLEETP